MRGTIAGFLAGGRQNPGAQSCRQNRGLLAGMISIEPIDAGFEEALLPADDRRSAGLQPTFDGVEGSSFGQRQNEPGAKDVTRRQRTRLRNAAEFGMLVIGKRDSAVCRHTNLDA